MTTVTAIDPNVPPQSLTYSITGGLDAAFFNINPSTGELTFISAPDFETPADNGGDNVYDVDVQVSDGGGGTDTQIIAVTIANVNEAPTDIDVSPTSVDENQPVDTVVGTLTSTDPDAGATFTYSLVTNPVACPAILDNAFVNILADELRTSEIFDFAARQ